METIDDIRARFGNPYAGDADGPVQPINHSFRHPDASLRLLSLVTFLAGVFVVLVGVWTLVVAISAVGIGIVVGSVIMFARAEYISHHVRDFQKEPEE